MGSFQLNAVRITPSIIILRAIRHMKYTVAGGFVR